MKVDVMLNGDTRQLLKKMPKESVQCVVTSVPYFGKRDYMTGKWIGGDQTCKHENIRNRGVRSSTLQGGKKNSGHQQEPTGVRVCQQCGAVREDKQIGLEITPELYLREMVETIFKDVHRILKKSGTLWLNIGDGFWGGKGRSGQESRESLAMRNQLGKSMNKDYHNTNEEIRAVDRRHPVYKKKDTIGMPWRLAFALQGLITLPGKTLMQWADMLKDAIAAQDWHAVEVCEEMLRTHAVLQCFSENGWYLRQEIIWAKPNVQPESATDRSTVMHEYIFLLTKSHRYKYNQEAIKEPVSENTNARMSRASKKAIQNGGQIQRMRKGVQDQGEFVKANKSFEKAIAGEVTMRNKRSVWTINSEPSFGGHTATFPQELARICILAGTDKGDIVCDVFAGEGTTCIVAEKLERHYIGMELNPKDIRTFQKRRHHEFALFKPEHMEEVKKTTVEQTKLQL